MRKHKDYKPVLTGTYQELQDLKEWVQAKVVETSADKNALLADVSESLFVKEFADSVAGDMYKYVDNYDYSQGMQQICKEEIEETGRDLYNHLLNSH